MVAEAREEGLRTGLNATVPEMLKMIDSLIAERDYYEGVVETIANSPCPMCRQVYARQKPAPKELSGSGQEIEGE